MLSSIQTQLQMKRNIMRNIRGLKPGETEENEDLRAGKTSE